MINGYNIEEIQASFSICIISDSALPVEQFITKTKDTINYNIYVINTTEQYIKDIRVIDILPVGAELISIAMNKGSYSLENNSIDFYIPLIKPKLYSKIVVSIKNNIVNEADNILSINGMFIL